MKIKRTSIILAIASFFIPLYSYAVTQGDLIEKYTTGSQKLRILIIPGHDDQYWGTQYREVREADLNLSVAQKLIEYFSQDKNVEVITTRTKLGYTQTFADYFTKNREQILTFGQEKRALMRTHIDTGVVKKVESVPHNAVNNDIAVSLYGINKWANENNVDLVIHLHFNDNPARPKDNPGVYKGFVVYIPESQYGNAELSKSFGAEIYKQLSTYYTKSNLPKEDAGLTEDQDLIALGASNTLIPPSVLIEYGYIYQPQFLDEGFREKIFKDLAYQTYIGVHRFLGDGTKKQIKHDTPLLPYRWTKTISKFVLKDSDVFALQVALRKEKLFPVEGMDPFDCELTGNFDPCTKRALIAFQKKYKINPTSGILGPLTRAKLNTLYSR